MKVSLSVRKPIPADYADHPDADQMEFYWKSVGEWIQAHGDRKSRFKRIPHIPTLADYADHLDASKMEFYWKLSENGPRRMGTAIRVQGHIIQQTARSNGKPG